MAIRVALGLTQLVVWLLVHLMTRTRGDTLMIGVRLGHEPTEADRARPRHVRVVNHTMLLMVIVALPLMQEYPALSAVVWLAPLVATSALVWASSRLMSSSTLAPLPARYTVQLDPPRALALVSPGLQLTFVVLVVGSSLLVAHALSLLPEVVPLHFGLDGHADRYGSPRELWIMLPILLATAPLMWGIPWMVAQERWALVPGQEQRSAALQLERRRLIVHMVEKVIVGVALSMSAIWVGLAYVLNPAYAHAAPLVIAGGLLLSAGGTVVPLLGMTRLNEVQDELTALGAPAAYGTREAGWRWGGALYVAPDDPAVFVPKRQGVGSTLNFARPTAWAILLGMVGVPIALALLGIVAVVR